MLLSSNERVELPSRLEGIKLGLPCIVSVRSMRPLLTGVAVAVLGPLALASSPACAADCDFAIRDATYVAAQGDLAFRTDSPFQAGNAAANARIPSIDAWQQAKACGCAEALPPLEDAAQTAARANLAFSLSNVQQYGARIRKDAEAALEALRRCAAR